MQFPFDIFYLQLVVKIIYVHILLCMVYTFGIFVTWLDYHNAHACSTMIWIWMSKFIWFLDDLQPSGSVFLVVTQFSSELEKERARVLPQFLKILVLRHGHLHLKFRYLLSTWPDFSGNYKELLLVLHLFYYTINYEQPFFLHQFKRDIFKQTFI